MIQVHLANVLLLEHAVTCVLSAVNTSHVGNRAQRGLAYKLGPLDMSEIGYPKFLGTHNHMPFIKSFIFKFGTKQIHTDHQFVPQDF